MGWNGEGEKDCRKKGGSKRIKEGGDRPLQAMGNKEQAGKEHEAGARKDVPLGHIPGKMREGGRQTEMKELQERGSIRKWVGGC
jgi:hypothetical protein